MENLVKAFSKNGCNCSECSKSQQNITQKSTSKEGGGGLLDGLFGDGIPVDTTVKVDIPAATLAKIAITAIIIFLFVFIIKNQVKK